MMKLKRFLLFTMVLCLIGSFIPIESKAVEVREGTSKYSNYVALGDSIAYGYGLDNRNTDSYASLVKSNYNIDSSKYSNNAIVGATCEDYYNLISGSEELKEKIRNADLITISVGSNELLGLIINAMAEAAGIDTNGGQVTGQEVYEAIQTKLTNGEASERIAIIGAVVNFFTSPDTQTAINAKISSYETYWDKTVKLLKELNPNAVIVATEFYNPYYGISIPGLDIGNFTGTAISNMNTILHRRSNNGEDYKIAEIYQSFNTTDPRLTNVNIDLQNFSKFNVDPHPNKQGHRLIATKIIEVADATEPKKETKKDISTLTISNIDDVVYTGKEIEPEITIKDNGVLLKKGTDYTVTYSNNKEVGNANATINGIGDYTGTVIKSFKIISPSNSGSGNSNGSGSGASSSNSGNSASQASQNTNSSKKRLPNTGTTTAIIGLIVITSIALVIITRKELIK